VTARPLKAGVIGLGVGEAHLKSYRRIDGVEVRESRLLFPRSTSYRSST